MSVVSRHVALSEGFTLIELLVATGIVLLLLGAGLGAYLQFDERQSIRRSRDQLTSVLRQAQKEARAGIRPDTCQRLESVSVAYAINSRNYRRAAECVSSAGQTTVILERYELSDGVTFASSGTIYFEVLRGGVRSAPITVTLEHSSGDTADIIVQSAGSINSE